MTKGQTIEIEATGLNNAISKYKWGWLAVPTKDGKWLVFETWVDYAQWQNDHLVPGTGSGG